MEALRQESRELLLIIGKIINTALARNQGRKSKRRLDAEVKKKMRSPYVRRIGG